MEEGELIFWDEASICYFSNRAQEEPPYLRPLCEAIKWSSSKTLDSILFTVLTQYMKDYTSQVEGYLKDNRLVSEAEKKSLFGIESNELKSEQEPVDECKAQVLALCFDHAVTSAQWVLAEVLLKTGLLGDCFDKQEAKRIQEKLQRKPDIYRKYTSAKRYWILSIVLVPSGWLFWLRRCLAEPARRRRGSYKRQSNGVQESPCYSRFRG